jgi:uncharacterized protein YgiM (DUF1202 family)
MNRSTANPLGNLVSSSLRCFVATLFCLLMITGCSRFRPALLSTYVYVTAKSTFLRDRVAAVSNRTATVNNGDRLKVLEHGRRFIRVETDKGEQGWIDEKVVADQGVFDGFADLKKAHENDPTVASGVVRDDVYMHTKPGRDTDRLFRLLEGDKLQLLTRATLPKVAPTSLRARAPVPVAPSKAANKTAVKTPEEAPQPPAMDDWWLVRDSKGRTGWMLSRLMDVDAPESLTRYAEGQRIVGAYVLNRVYDPEAPQDDKNIPEYLAVLSPYKAGLPYDFNQARLFIWNVKKHRYETGFRDKNIEGYLPVTITKSKDPSEKTPVGAMDLPTFRYRVLSADAAPVVPDSTTGAIVPGKTVLKTYRLEGNITHRVLAPGQTAPGESHPIPPEERKKGKRRR